MLTTTALPSASPSCLTVPNVCNLIKQRLADRGAVVSHGPRRGPLHLRHVEKHVHAATWIKEAGEFGSHEHVASTTFIGFISAVAMVMELKLQT
uniref:Uncharacterized protein n=1 Tax=Knipowitschia caucasica TaxID=637954 RepID=A0AAV2M7G6_KNICA